MKRWLLVMLDDIERVWRVPSRVITKDLWLLGHIAMMTPNGGMVCLSWISVIQAHQRSPLSPAAKSVQKSNLRESLRVATIEKNTVGELPPTTTPATTPATPPP